MFVRDLRRRTYRKEVVISGPEDIYKLCKKMAKYEKEHFVAILLNSRHAVLAVDTISIGSLNASIVHPREVFLPAIRQIAASLVLVHNHPSGLPDPSEEDLAITRRLVEAGRLLGIEVVDHIIIGNHAYVSLKEHKLMK